MAAVSPGMPHSSAICWAYSLLGLRQHPKYSPARDRALSGCDAERPNDDHFRDWIVSGANRIALLRDAFAAARDAGMIISTVAENPDWPPFLPDETGSGVQRTRTSSGGVDATRAGRPACRSSRTRDGTFDADENESFYASPSRQRASKQLRTCWAAIARCIAPSPSVRPSHPKCTVVANNTTRMLVRTCRYHFRLLAQVERYGRSRQVQVDSAVS